MSTLVAKAIGLIALPVVVFLIGVWAMSTLSDRDYVVQRLRTSAAPKDQEPLYQRLGYDVPAVSRHWGALDDTARRCERRFLQLDLVFPIFYGAALAVSLLLAGQALGRPRHPGWLVVPVAITVLADWTENLVQLAQLQRYVADGMAALQPGWIHLASVATIIKLLFFYSASLLLVGLIVSMVVRAVKPT